MDYTNIITQLKAMNLQDFIKSQGINLKKASAKSMNATCPFHNEKTASFHVYEDNYHCFGCGAHGDIIQFVQNHHSLEFIESVKHLAQQFQIELPKEDLTQDQIQKQLDLKLMYDINQAVTKYYQVSLKANPQAIDYLKSRGITGESARDFKIGYVPNQNHLVNYIAKLFNLNQEVATQYLTDLNLILKSDKGYYYDNFRNRIVFPIQSSVNHIHGFSCRSIDQQTMPKYKNSAETPIFKKSEHFYGLTQAREGIFKTKKVILVEGNIDVIKLHQAGFNNAIAILGTAFTQNHIELLYQKFKSFKDELEIIFCFDGDDAGRKLMVKTIDMVKEKYDDKQIFSYINLKQGDPAENISTFEEIFKARKPFAQFVAETFHSENKANYGDNLQPLFNKVKTFVLSIKHAKITNNAIISALSKLINKTDSEIKETLFPNLKKDNPVTEIKVAYNNPNFKKLDQNKKNFEVKSKEYYKTILNTSESSIYNVSDVVKVYKILCFYPAKFDYFAQIQNSEKITIEMFNGTAKEQDKLMDLLIELNEFKTEFEISPQSKESFIEYLASKNNHKLIAELSETTIECIHELEIFSILEIVVERAKEQIKFHLFNRR